MGKGKPRWYPDKKQKNYNQWCQACEDFKDENGKEYYSCEGYGRSHAEVCKGNPHNCIKTYYHRLASRSNKNIINGDYKPR